MKLIRGKLGHLLILAFISFLPLVPFTSLAVDIDDQPCDISGKICNPLSGSTTVDGFIKKFLEGAIKIGIPIIALAIIYSGFLFVAARGNPESLTKAKDTLLYTLIGAAILIGSWAIAKLISETVLAL
ncbi:MAG: hypothetical protein WD991_02510 [Candidatus Paceibacterota bacterium]